MYKKKKEIISLREPWIDHLQQQQLDPPSTRPIVTIQEKKKIQSKANTWDNEHKKMKPQEANRTSITFVQKQHATIKRSSLADLEPQKVASTVISTTSISHEKIHQG